jgi:cob(I)alamin adenosyltransferase
LVIVYTGNGKGKTSAAFGNVFRALGHGMKVLVVQFLKGDWGYGDCGEQKSAVRHKNLQLVQCGRGFCGILGDNKPRKEHRLAAQHALDLAQKKISSGAYDLVVLDEIHCALSQRLLKSKQIVRLLKNKPDKTHVILTGRGAPAWLLRVADLVTEMKEIKHPFRRGITARRGIDY